MQTLLTATLILLAPPGPDAAKKLAAVKEIWKAQANEVVTAKIHFRLKRGAGVTGLSSTEVKKLFTTTDFATAEGRDKFLSVVYPGANNLNREWNRMEFRKEGSKTREISTELG